MTANIWFYLHLIYEWLIFVYAVLIMGSYLVLLILSAFEIRRYLKRNSYINHRLLVGSPFSPGISIIAPAYNEASTIKYNVHSLLSLNYPVFEVIIINDGSTDDTLQQLIAEYEMEPVDFAYFGKIITQPVRRLYKSRNPVYFRLLVVDKENGGSKADASNAGINASSYPIFLCTDVDCILHPDTLLKMVKPFIEEKEKVIATGAVIRIVNSCEVESGVVTRVKVPTQFFPLFQELEYVRAFLLGRMAWSRINALLLVSGGLGMFDKETVIAAGGYDHASFGEDMELITRMRRYMEEQKKPYKVRYIPESLCWTEVPHNLRVFARQRTRWAKGLAQNLWMHKKTLFNPKYGRLGMVSMPYWLLFEWLAPIVEFTGILYYLYIIITGAVNWPYAIILLVFVYMFSVMITVTSVLWDEITHKQYASKGEVLKLCTVALLEPIFYHPLVLFFAIRGNYFFLTGRKLAWGDMVRQGFKRKKVNAAADQTPSTTNTPGE
jgi:cellulose synthase/poly-beta-1,6-N-acetylglucosamine synthase-like glycosyltransferase